MSAPRLIALGLLATLAAVSTTACLWGMPKDHSIAAYATSIEGRTKSQRYNAGRALNRLDGAEIKPGQTFSFNTYVGSYARDDGYRKAPVSYNGQLIDSWGGGVCQASTTLYNAALLAGMTVVERHRHEFCPSYVSPGRDAAVAYDDIDLKFKNPWPFPVRIHSFVDGNMLRVEVLANQPLRNSIEVREQIRTVEHPSEFAFGSEGPGRVRNSGKPGYDVAVFRLQGGRRSLISFDSYPAMNRVVQYGD